MKTKERKIKSLLKKAIQNSPTGVSFVHLSNYKSTKNEVSNQLINVGASLQKAKERDMEYLKNLDLKTLDFKGIDSSIVETAKDELLTSLITPNQNRSDGQTNAYTYVGPNMKVHNETGKLYIAAPSVSKTVIVEGEYKKVNSQPKTIAKRIIQKGMGSAKFKLFVVDEINKIATSGDTISIS